MAYTRAGMKAVDRYVKANYDRLDVKLPRGRKTDVEAYATQKGISINKLINNLLQAEMGMSDDDWTRKPI